MKVFTEVYVNLVSALNFCSGELSSLHEELDSWRSGMEGTNLENTEKYATLEESTETLEEAMNAIDEVINSGDLAEYDGEDAKPLDGMTYKVGAGRSWRCAAVLGTLAVIVNTLRERADELEKSTSEADHEKAVLLDEHADSLEEADSNLEGVEFPGMFG